jgi:hypothetical protein
LNGNIKYSIDKGENKMSYGYDCLELGASPMGENCVQVEETGAYYESMRAECSRYKEMLKKRFPMAANMFRIKSFSHEFGSYCEVVIVYTEDEDACNKAYFVEGNLPELWSDEEVFESIPEMESEY